LVIYKGSSWKKIGKAWLNLSSYIDKGEMIQQFRIKCEGLGLTEARLDLRIKVSWPETPGVKISDSYNEQPQTETFDDPVEQELKEREEEEQLLRGIMS
jgi:hypothetical protein